MTMGQDRETAIFDSLQAMQQKTLWLVIDQLHLASDATLTELKHVLQCMRKARGKSHNHHKCLDVTLRFDFVVLKDAFSLGGCTRPVLYSIYYAIVFSFSGCSAQGDRGRAVPCIWLTTEPCGRIPSDMIQSLYTIAWQSLEKMVNMALQSQDTTAKSEAAGEQQPPQFSFGSLSNILATSMSTFCMICFVLFPLSSITIH